MKVHAYNPTGLLAVDPRALGGMYAEHYAPATPTQETVAVIPIRGPLAHHQTYWMDSYEGIVDRVAEALSMGPKSIVLAIDSPGGAAAGVFDAARKLRTLAQTAGVPLYCHVEGTAASAAYALATAAEKIVVSPSAIVGSVGVIDALVDATKANEMNGVAFSLVTSGDRKADGNPLVPTTPAALSAAQTRVDALAAEFFALVAEHRGVGAEAVRGLQAGLFVGSEAVRLGLADEVGTMDDLLALASGQRPAEAGSNLSEETMDEEEKNARKALQAIIDDDDKSDAKKAKARKALKAMDDSDEDESAESEEDKKEAKAEGDKEEPEASTMSATVQAMASQISTLTKRAEDQDRAALLSSRSDIKGDFRELLASMPVAKVREILATIPAPKAPAPAAGSTTVAATRGATQTGDVPGAVPVDLDSQMQAAMGMVNTKHGVKREGVTLMLGASVPAKPSDPATPSVQE